MKKKEKTEPTFDALHHRAKTGDLVQVLENNPNQRMQFALEDYTGAVEVASEDPSKENIKQVARFFDGLRGQAQSQANKGVTIYLDAIPLRVGGGGGISERTTKRNAMVDAMRKDMDEGEMTALQILSHLHDTRFGIRANKEGEYKPFNDYITSLLTTIADAQLKNMEGAGEE